MFNSVMLQQGKSRNVPGEKCFTFGVGSEEYLMELKLQEDFKWQKDIMWGTEYYSDAGMN